MGAGQVADFPIPWIKSVCLPQHFLPSFSSLVGYNRMNFIDIMRSNPLLTTLVIYTAGLGNNMAELKTKRTGKSVQAFLDSIPDEKRRKDCYTILKL
jgi:hypothetical protein